MASAAGFAQLLKDVAKPALLSGGLATGVSLLGGANPLQALASGAVDVAADVVTLGTLRKLAPGAYAKKTLIDPATGKKVVQQGSHPLETPLNIAASIGAGYATAPLIYGNGQPQQIAQQVEQRALKEAEGDKSVAQLISSKPEDKAEVFKKNNESPDKA